MDNDPNTDFLSWTKISQQSIKAKSACINYLDQFLALLISYYNNSHKLPKPNEEYTKQFENEVIPNVISNIILMNDGNDIFVSNLASFLKKISILLFSDIIKCNFKHVDTFLLIFNYSNKLYSHGMTPFNKGPTFSDVCTNFLKENPFQSLLRIINNSPSFPVFHVIYSLFDNFKDFVNPTEIESKFHQTKNQFIFLLKSIKTENLNQISPKFINACLKYVFKYTAKKENYENLWEKCSDFLIFSLKNGDSEHQTMAAKSIYQMVDFSDLYREQVIKRIKDMNIVNLLMNNDEYDEKLIGYFTSIISKFLTICMPEKEEILRLYDIITENENSKLKTLFLFFIKNMSTENSVDLFSTIFETRPTTKKHVEILSLCISELIILNFMVGNKIISHFLALIKNDESAEVSILFFQKILPLPLPKEIVSLIVEIASKKITEKEIKETSINFMRVIITIPNRLTIKYTFSLFNSIICAMENHEDKAEVFFDMIISALAIYQKSVLSTEQLKKLLPIINKNQWWGKLSSLFMKRSSLFFTSNGLIEFENEIEKFDFEKASPQFTLFLLSFISHLCVYKKIYIVSSGNYISVQNIPDLNYIIRIIVKAPDHQSFVYIMNYFIFVWNHLEKVSSRDATIHFLHCFKPYIINSSNEVKNRIFQLMCKLIDVLEKSISIEDFGLKRHKKSNILDIDVIAYIENRRSLNISIKENQTLDDILKKAAFVLGLSPNCLKFKEIFDPYISIKQTNLRKFDLEIISEKRKEIKLNDLPTQIFVENEIDEILLSYLEYENSNDAWNLLVKLPTNQKLMKKLSNPNEIQNNFISSNLVSKLYFRYEIESLLEVVKSNNKSYENYGIFILKELIEGRIEGEEITQALEIIYLSNPDLKDTEIKDTLLFLLSKGENGFTPLFDKLAQKYPNQIYNFFMVEKSISNEYIYSVPTEYISIICSFAENYNRDTVFQYLNDLTTNLYKFKNSIEPILFLYDKIICTKEEALLLIDKINNIIPKLKQNQYSGLCISLMKILKRFPEIESDISKLIPYIINQLYETSDIDNLLSFLVALKSQSTPEICKFLKVNCDFFNYSTAENERRYFVALKNDIGKDMSFLSSMLQQLFFNQEFKSLIISEKVDIDWYDSLRKLFCILQFSNLPFYSMSEIYNTMKLFNMTNPSRFYDFVLSSLPSRFSEPFVGTILDLQQDLSSQVITSKQMKFLKLQLEAKERYSVSDCLEHFFQERKVAFKHAVHHFNIGEFPNVLVLLLKIFDHDKFQDLYSKIGTNMIVSENLQLSIKSNITNSPVYELRGVIYHKGRIYGGRYISQIIHEGNSYLFDNDTVYNFERTEDMSPFILFYVKQGIDENKNEIEIPDDIKDFITKINESYQRNQILFSDNFRLFILNFNDALLITRYLINIFCHSKFDPELIKEYLNKELVNVSKALHFYQKNVTIINKIPDKQMKKMMLYLAEVLIDKASKNVENDDEIKDFFSSCIKNVESKSLYELMMFYITQINSNKSDITSDWGERISSIIINENQSNSWQLFPILTLLKYNNYKQFFANGVISMIYSDNNSSNAFLKYLKSIDVDLTSIIELTPSKFYSNLLISSLQINFTDICVHLLESQKIEKKFFLKSLLIGLENQIDGLRDSIISHFSFILNFLSIPEGKFVEAVIYDLFPYLINPIESNRKRMKFNNNKGLNKNEEEEDDDDDSLNNEEEEEEEEWEEEEVNQIQEETEKVDKITDEKEKNSMNYLFQLIVKFLLNFKDDQLLYFTLRVINWMIDVGNFMNDDLIDACLKIILKRIDKKRIVKADEKCLLFKIMKNFPERFFDDHFAEIVKFSFPTSHPSIFSHFFYTTSNFLSKDSNKAILYEFIKSPSFFDSFRKFLKRSNINDLDLFIDNARQIQNVNFSEIMKNQLLHRLTIQKVICYQSFAQEIDKKMVNHLLRFYFRKCSPFEEKYIPLFGRFANSISQIMKFEIPRSSSIYLKNASSVFSLFERDESKPFRKELQTIIINMSRSDNSVRSKFVELIMDCHSTKSRQLQIDLFSTFFYICNDSKLINRNLEMLANFIDNCKQREVLNILNSIESMLSKRSKNDGFDSKNFIANGIESEKIFDILIILLDFYDWIPEIANCFQFILSFLSKSNVLCLVESLLNVVAEREDDEKSGNESSNQHQTFNNNIDEAILKDVIKKGVSFLAARPELKNEILDLFKDGGYLENWPPELQQFRSIYFYDK